MDDTPLGRRLRDMPAQELNKAMAADGEHTLKDAYDPPLTLVWSPRQGLALWVGGSRAADDASVLHAHGIKAKCCLAGTHAPLLGSPRPGPRGIKTKIF